MASTDGKVSAAATSAPKPDRHIADFHPTIWGYQFLKDASEFKPLDPKTKEEYEHLKQEVRKMIVDTATTSIQKLHLIDAVQRLGVAYQFVKELEDALEKIYNDSDIDDYNDLRNVSHHFRLLRQHGIKISCDVFEKFKDDDGKFNASLIDDVQGMLNLYEAAYLAIQGEDILDEALAFTATHLNLMVSHVSPHLAEQINHTLNRPLRKGLPRLEARFYMSTVYPRDDSHNKTLLKFAKLDYNILQEMHQKDLSDILQWWKNLDLTEKLPYARDRVVEEYFWILGIFFEPQYAYGAKILTQVFRMLVIMDDTCDAYGTFEELTLFTEAVRRWELGAIGILPDYMKHIYKALLDLYAEIEEDMVNKGKQCYMSYVKERTQSLVEAYNIESKWANEKYVPTHEEYMTVGLETAAVELIIAVAYLGMDGVTKKDFDWLWSNPKLVTASKVIIRLMDDLVTHKAEVERGHCASSIECYMKQHGVSEEEAVKETRKRIANAWKDMNEEMLKPTAVSVPVFERVFNYARLVDVIYKDCDGFSDAYKLKDQVALLLRDPVPL